MDVETSRTHERKITAKASAMVSDTLLQGIHRSLKTLFASLVFRNCGTLVFNFFCFMSPPQVRTLFTISSQKLEVFELSLFPVLLYVHLLCASLFVCDLVSRMFGFLVYVFVSFFHLSLSVSLFVV